MEELRYRQIHMDFHTSEKIEHVAERFDKREFAETLKNAHVNSVTCFARCHHGMMYYNSKKFPGLIHPELKNKNLLQDQIDACHEQGIRVPVYTTVQWDYHMSMEHPEWVCLNSDGSMVYYCREGEKAEIYQPGFYRTLCVNSGYREYLKEHIKDLFDVLTPQRIDGLFLDIVSIVDCSCRHCVEGMRRKGYNPEQKEERLLYAKEMLDDFKRDMTGWIHQLKPEASVFYNCGHINPYTMDAKEAYTHWELESLPSGDWGYSHFVNTVRYVRTKEYDFLAHTGKFHTSWGDFHSFKNKEALEFECFRMLAYNAKCLIGDQLEPDGKISKDVYELIGKVYSQVEQKEAWCRDAKARCDIAVVTPEKLNIGTCGAVPDEVNGVCQMLDELGMQLDIIDFHTNFSEYRLIILPDTVLLEETQAQKLENYVQKGGKLLVTGDSGLDLSKTHFMLECLGVRLVGSAPYCPDFLMPNELLGSNLPKTEHVMYQRGNQVEVTDGTILADTYIPYFNRTWEHFCSHKHTPSSHKNGYPGVVRKGDSIYFMHPVFSIYQENHPKWCKELIKDAIKLLLPDPVLECQGPSTLIATLNRQKKEQRDVLHLLHYIPVKVSKDLYTIEDVIPLYQVPCKIRIEEKVVSVKTVPEGEGINFSQQGNLVEFTVPRIQGHRMVEISYQNK